jgi:hypothetical protein
MQITVQRVGKRPIFLGISGLAGLGVEQLVVKVGDRAVKEIAP